MNYDLMTWIEYFIGAFTCCLGSFIVGKILLNKEFKEIKTYSYFLLILFSIFTIVNSLTFDNVAKIFGTLFVFFLVYKLIFKLDYVNGFLYTITTYIIFILSEVTVSMLGALIETIFDVSIMIGAIKTILINFIISVLSCIYSYFLKMKVKKIVNVVNKDNTFYIFILGVITIFVTISSMYKLYLNNWIINYSFILNTIVIFGCLILIFVLLKEYLKNKEITHKYVLLEDYMKTSASLVEKYSSTVHKYKNNLIALKGYMKSDIKEANKYIDDLLEIYKNKKYSWFSKINYIQVDTIRYLVYYKLSKAEEVNLKISVDVSSDIKKFDCGSLTINEVNTILEILGEYFDNAIYASSESKEKEISFILYVEDNKLVFIIANTYKEKFDLDSITKNGYTTKGKNHGFGLYDVDKTLKKLTDVQCTYELSDNYFVATLKVDMNKK